MDVLVAMRMKHGISVMKHFLTEVYTATNTPEKIRERLMEEELIKRFSYCGRLTSIRVTSP